MLTKLKNPWLDWDGPKVRRHRPQYTILVLALILVMVGAVVQFTISPAQVVQRTVQLGTEPWGGQNSYFYRHLLALLVGIGAMVVGFKIHIRHWLQWSPWLLVVSLALAIITGLSGSRWLGLGQNWSVQPVEVVKLGVIMVVAGFVLKAANHRSRSLWEMTKSNCWSLVLLALVAFVIGWLQGDLGSLVVILIAALAIIIVSGIGWQLIASLASAGLAGVAYLILEAPYRLTRVITFLQPAGEDCLAQGYHVCQALISVGSGGFWGRGFGRSVQAFGYLPETVNDSIFAIYAEIAGFFGAIILLSLFFYLFRTVYRQILKLEDPLVLVATGILAWLVSQMAINIGSMLDLLPMKGITLPYISFGGTSLVMVMFATGLLLQISTYSRYDDDQQRHRPGLLVRWWSWWVRYYQTRVRPARR